MLFFQTKRKEERLYYIASFKDYLKNIHVTVGNFGQEHDTLTFKHLAEAAGVASSYPRLLERDRHLQRAIQLT